MSLPFQSETAASQVSSQGITHFPNEWARLSAAGEINSGEAKAASTNLVRRQRAHAQAHASLFGELPRPTNLNGQQGGYQDFLSAATAVARSRTRRMELAASLPS